MIAGQLYSDSWPEYYYETPNIGSDEAPNSYYPSIIKNVKTFICPSTKNEITLEGTGAVIVDRNGVARYRDLINTCHGDRESKIYKNGHSYETFGFFELDPLDSTLLNSPPVLPWIRKNPKTVLRGPSRVVIFLDADDPASIPGNAENNCPDPPNNHREKGWNWAFTDGHGEWVVRSKTSYMITNGWMRSGRACPPAL